jgi:hypothetical protein
MGDGYCCLFRSNKPHQHSLGACDLASLDLRPAACDFLSFIYHRPSHTGGLSQGAVGAMNCQFFPPLTHKGGGDACICDRPSVAVGRDL